MWFAKVFKCVYTTAVQHTIANAKTVKKLCVPKIQANPLHSSDENALNLKNNTHQPANCLEEVNKYTEKEMSNHDSTACVVKGDQSYSCSGFVLTETPNEEDFKNFTTKLPSAREHSHDMLNKCTSKDEESNSVKNTQTKSSNTAANTKALVKAFKSIATSRSNRSVFSGKLNNNLCPLAMSRFGVQTFVHRMYSNKSGNKIDIFDVNWEDQQSDDDEEEYDDQVRLPTKCFSSLQECPLTPIDIDAWEDEDVAKEGTLLIKPYADNPFEYPPPPKNRTGEYKFRGVTVVLPKSWLTPGLYRYRYDKKDKDELADDIRVIKFPK
ncbi:uncharacterized protein LOC119689048 [Teleopsis dalmanni]|uniref:uncharacterized protein LOC119689048 n=1 Tax=Teleopsis dalmanni TaxID=139649 RepID=UPI0018CD83C8|nr:uncharacterized protein LOC119689048 [Teleopsis dalmanni]